MLMVFGVTSIPKLPLPLKFFLIYYLIYLNFLIFSYLELPLKNHLTAIAE
ncbi:hypothetical protein HMPREF9371_0122 [Neisseria shayeganii 871]|uniref:Uncharacterized protein n=1 Tax=Neisseria shayeganii 871 TaxID=1032488 RepID=G4CET3_9NEIS|nr:hypothetical protein HMPREF9371_0122 [Neisseria shayeganii 871]